MSVFHRLHVLLAEIENLLAKKYPQRCLKMRLRAVLLAISGNVNSNRQANYNCMPIHLQQL